jgi:hypothetical protein
MFASQLLQLPVARFTGAGAQGANRSEVVMAEEERRRRS